MGKLEIMVINMTMNMKYNILVLSALLLLTSCYEDYVRDYDYTAAYAAYQYDLRTFVYGEDVEVGFTTAFGGVASNEKDREVQVKIDNSLLSMDLSAFDPDGHTASFTAIDGLLGRAPLGTLSQSYVTSEIAASGITALNPLPESYYTTSGPVTIKQGYHTGDLFLYPTEDMFQDNKILKPYYALGFLITKADVDRLIPEKSFQIMAVKVENRFWGNWYHGGRRVVIRNADGDIVSEDRYALEIPQADIRNYVLTTETVNSVLTDKLSNNAGSMRLTFLADNEIKVEDVSGAKELRNILGQPSHHNGASLIQDREIYLNYAFSNGDGSTTYVTDTLAFRNRIRDGVNEWQDENTKNYK